MKLASITFEGYRRFLEATTLKTSSKLTVLIGPNEAGKSSILRLLKSLSDDSQFSPQDRYKFADDVEIQLSAKFHLEPEDQAAIGSANSTSYILTKDDCGDLHAQLTPEIARNKTIDRNSNKTWKKRLSTDCLLQDFPATKLISIEFENKFPNSIFLARLLAKQI